MADWKSDVERTLESGMRYCFKPEGGKYPELDENAFRPPHESGFLDLFISIVRNLRKEAFYQGYARGAADATYDMGKEKFAFDEQLSWFGAEKAWNKLEAKEEEN